MNCSAEGLGQLNGQVYFENGRLIFLNEYKKKNAFEFMSCYIHYLRVSLRNCLIACMFGCLSYKFE